MKRLALCCVPLVLGLACWPVAVDAGKTAPFTIDPIRALFVTSEFATDYRITWRQPLRGTVKPEVEWSLHLQIVGGDAGKPYPGLPGSGGAVDPGCTNAGVGIEKSFDGSKTDGAVHDMVDHITATNGVPFRWHHPDAAESKPPGRYHCNHQDMGPHGHQGLITVTVTADRYRCTAHYLGTNSGQGDEPTCRKIP